jgi:hypothetical protein
VAEKVTIRISAGTARYIGSDKPRQERMKAAAGEVKLPPQEFVLLIYYLCHDQDTEVKSTALKTFRSLSTRFLAELLKNRELHGRVLDALVQIHGKTPELVPLLAAHPMLSDKAAAYLAAQHAVPGAAPTQAAAAGAGAVQAEAGHEPEAPAAAAPAGAEGAAEEADDEGPVDETTEEFRSKYQLSQAMGVGDKIKAALTGDKEWRTILIKDANKLVSGSVVKNPRITENEILAISKSSVQNEEVMRVIVANKDWIKNASIRKALVYNNKTPLTAALRFIPTLSEKELSLLSKSKNVNSVIVSQARRILLSKKDR